MAFFRPVPAYVEGMRAFILALAIFCGILSGWTSAVAQAQDLAHGKTVVAAHGAHGDDIGGSSGSSDCAGACHDPVKTSHPMLCSACFALEVEAGDLGRLPGPVQRLRPAAELPLTASTPKPAAPPPKTALST
ncbi:hypothetical protein [Rhizobium sp. 9140]|uniref:hypothetical protein n=1 Tax=Rhizobium sp. 9140 TaxID=1761900 RepID=UPI0007928684|nr:hypothetical protein [Rhizobium sp. 9140]CZT34320.1 hypothetical protein GA0004734_00013400 [Rhizobium sp. 9140]